MKNNMEDKLWLVEWCYATEDYRISRYADPAQAVAYEDSWQDAVRDIKANYGIDEVIIFITKSDGTVDYCCEPDYV